MYGMLEQFKFIMCFTLNANKNIKIRLTILVNHLFNEHLYLQRKFLLTNAVWKLNAETFLLKDAKESENV